VNKGLWIVQWILALLFLFAGGVKLVMPADQMAEMTKQMQMSSSFLRFIGVVEVLGALGLILPGLLHIRTGLTPLAAAGLVIVMIGAVVVSIQAGPAVTAILPFLTGLLAAFVSYARWRKAPL
jgi:hypothetical protein